MQSTTVHCMITPLLILVAMTCWSVDTALWKPRLLLVDCESFYWLWLDASWIRSTHNKFFNSSRPIRVVIEVGTATLGNSSYSLFRLACTFLGGPCQTWVDCSFAGGTGISSCNCYSPAGEDLLKLLSLASSSAAFANITLSCKRYTCSAKQVCNPTNIDNCN